MFHFKMIIFDQSGEKLRFFFISVTINLLCLLVNVLDLAESSHTISKQKIVINRCQFFFLNFWYHGKIVVISLIAVIISIRYMLPVCPCFSHDGSTKSVYIFLLMILLLCNKTQVQYDFLTQSWRNLLLIAPLRMRVCPLSPLSVT